MSRGYEPNPALGWIYGRFFEHITIDEAWAARIREAASKGIVIYALRNLSFVDFLALDYLTKRFHLPRVRFANDLGLFLLEPMGRGWGAAIRRAAFKPDDAADLRKVVASGGSAALFLKRPPGLFEPGARGHLEGDVFVRALLDVQRTTSTPILICPQVFVWSRTPDRTEIGLTDVVFGPREWPGKARTIAQFIANYRHVTLRAADPINLRTFQQEAGGTPVSSQVRRITYALLRRLERERRAVLGPTEKSAERLRDEVLRSPKLASVINDMAGPGEAQKQALANRATRMLRLMESSLDMNAVGVMDRVFDSTVARMYERLEVDQPGLEKLREKAKEGVLVFLPSHKSHADYILLSRVFLHAKMPIPRVAAGDNLSFFPLGPVLRRAGAFFIRRSFQGDRLYSAVVDAYMRRLLKDGHPLEFFLEGGRSRTGKLLPPKLGLLSMVVDATLATRERPVYFCPVAVTYERMVEEEAIAFEVTGGEKRKEDASGLVRAARTMFGEYGAVSVQFGEPVSLEDLGYDPAVGLTPPKRRALISRLAFGTMREINRVTAVTPGALVAMALLLGGGRGVDHETLVQRCETLFQLLRATGARMSEPLGTRSVHPRLEALLTAINLFAKAGYVRIDRPGAPARPRSGGNAFTRSFGRVLGRTQSLMEAGAGALYRIEEHGRLALDFPKNTIMHFFVDRALVALAFGSEQTLEKAELARRVLSLSKLFKYEFTFRTDISYDLVLDETLRAMVERKELQADWDATSQAGHIEHAPLHVAMPNRLALYRRMLRNFLEGYRVAARTLRELARGALTTKELSKRALAVGDRMHIAGEIDCREAVSKALFETAFQSFEAQGYITRKDGHYTLTETYASGAMAATVEGKLVYFLERIDRGPMSEQGSPS